MTQFCTLKIEIGDRCFACVGFLITKGTPVTIIEESK